MGVRIVKKKKLNIWVNLINKCIYFAVFVGRSRLSCMKIHSVGLNTSKYDPETTSRLRFDAQCLLPLLFLMSLRMAIWNSSKSVPTNACLGGCYIASDNVKYCCNTFLSKKIVGYLFAKMYTLSGGTHILRQMGMCCFNGSLFYKQSLNTVPIFYKKNP